MTNSPRAASEVGQPFCNAPCIASLVHLYSVTILNVNLMDTRMRILVLSDLHANVTALDAVLEAAQGPLGTVRVSR